jgi:predicted membrane channel-forming protein YqfA (hemolysin III family)
MSLTESFQKPEYRALRGFIFLTLGLLGAIPFVHIIIFM